MNDEERKRRIENLRLAKREKEIQETTEKRITEQDVLRRKMKLMDEIEARMKKEKSEDYIEKLAEEYDRKEDATFKEELAKQYQTALDHYKLMLSDSFQAYKTILNAVQDFTKGDIENQSLVLVFEGLSNHECRLLFKVLHNGKIANPSQLKIIGNKSK